MRFKLQKKMPTARGVNLREVGWVISTSPSYMPTISVCLQVVRHSLGVTEGDVEGQALVDDMLNVRPPIWRVGV